MEKRVLSEWQSAQDKLGVRQGQSTLVLFGIIFNDPLWDGAGWKAGNPQRALTRLSSLSKEAVQRWAEASGVKELPFISANALITVEGLFANDEFQITAFDRALPIAQQRLSP